MDRIRKDDHKIAVFGFLAAAALLLLSGWFFPAVFLVPFVLCAVVAVSGAAGFASAVLSFAGIALLRPVYAALLAAMFLPLCAAAGFVIRKRVRMRDSVLIVGGAAIAGAAGAIGILWLITGLGPIDYTVTGMGQTLHALDDATVSLLYQSLRFGDLLTGATTQAALLATPVDQAISAIQQIYKDFLNVNLVSFIALYALLAGLLCFVIPRAYAKKRGLGVVTVPSFGGLTLPPRFWLAFVLSYLFAMIGESYGWASFDILKVTLLNAYGFVFIIQGLSFLDYLYKKRGLGKGVRVLLHVVVTLLVGYILMFVGLFENITNLRKRMDMEGGTVL